MQVCRDCSDKAYSYHPWLALIFTLFLGLGLVACAVAFNLGISPTLDSLLFFIQVSPFIMYIGQLCATKKSSLVPTPSHLCQCYMQKSSI